MHCHQVKERLNANLKRTGKWTRDLAWRYPLPENLGITLDVDRGNIVKKITVKSPAAAAGVRVGDRLTPELHERLLAEEYEKLRTAGNRDVHDTSKTTTLPVAREIVAAYVTSGVKLPWFIDLLNINLGNHDLAEAKRRIQLFIEEFGSHSRRVTGNIDFDAEGSA